MIKKCEYCIGDNHISMLESLKIHYSDQATSCPYCGRYLGENDYHKTEKVEVINRNDDVLGNIEERHPAYAQLTVHRQSGGWGNLYGSAIKHQDTICIEVHKSSKISSEYSERYYSGGLPLISIRMSNSQFAQAITTLNQGSGTPVTLESFHGKVMPNCEEITVSERANDNLKKKLKDFTKKISKGQTRVEEIMNKKGGILKGERKEIKNIFFFLMQDLNSNMPFLHQCMTEAYDKTSTAAKADIEAFYDNAIRRMGIEAVDKIKKIELKKGGEREV